MKFSWRLAGFLVVVLLSGCGKTGQPSAGQSATNAVAQSLEDRLPKQAQPKLPTMKLYVGAEVLDSELALTGEQIVTGMMYRTNIQDTDSMLFLLPVPQRASFWMYHCPESISCAYISPDGVIQEIHHLEHMDTNAVVAASDNIQFVLETSDGWFARHNVSTGMVIRTEKGSLAETFLRR
ncbi:MAG TPA: DUF192 domain-containing protein [Candidatus Acidoferrales bacterium]|nr:DUF192 domain-containing protein [Candidatus Acidoferrales bacterium]